jgi:hypothetical protein
LGPHKGLWGRVNLGDEKAWSHAKFRKDIIIIIIITADAAVQPQG